MSMAKKVAIALVSAIVLAVGILYYISQRDLLNGKDYLKNATRSFEKVEIKKHGDQGIKYVEADTFFGAVYGLGVLHARDRLWQLYFFRLVSQGRVSEVPIWFTKCIAWRQLNSGRRSAHQKHRTVAYRTSECLAPRRRKQASVSQQFSHRDSGWKHMQRA